MGYRIHPSVLFTDLDDGTSVLLHLESKHYYTLNDSGTIIWRALMQNEGKGADELSTTLASDALDVTPDLLRADMQAMFDEMVGEQILLEEQA